MFPLISRLFKGLLPNDPQRKKAPGRSLRRVALLELESLEDRCLLSAASISVTSAIAQAAQADFYGANPPHETGPMVKLGYELCLAYEEFKAYQQQRGPGAAPFVSADQSLDIRNNMVLLDTISANPTALKANLLSLGAQVSGVAKDMVSAFVPLAQLPKLAALSTLKSVDISKPITQAAPIVTEGDTAEYSNWVRQYIGAPPITGAGVTVGVISDSFDTTGTNYAVDIASGQLPPGINVIQDDTVAVSGAPSTDEGRAMLQIVHGVAPGSSLSFATGDFGQAGFANNIGLLASHGAKVINDDLSYFDEPFFEDGVVAQAVESVASTGTAYFSAAGNDAEQSYQSTFNPGKLYAAGIFKSAVGVPLFLGGEAHNFATSGPENDFQNITLDPGAFVQLGFQWESPYASLGNGNGATTELDIYLIDTTTATVVAASTNFTINGDPIQDLFYQNVNPLLPQNLDLMIVQSAGTTNPGIIKYINFTDGAPGVTINDFDTQSSTSFGHANAANMAAVAAVDYLNTPAFGASPPVLEPFSSSGGTPILFNTNGSQLATPLLRQEPLFAAPDGVTTTVISPADGSPFAPFFGTSAATPHAAATAALMLQANPKLTPAAIFTDLENTATPTATSFPPFTTSPSFNFNSGFGLINATDAVLSTGSYLVTVDAGALKNNGIADLFNVVLNGNHTSFSVNGKLVFTGLTSGIGSIIINGSRNNDKLVINSSGSGNIIPAGGLTFNGLGGTNSMVVTLNSSVGGGLTFNGGTATSSFDLTINGNAVSPGAVTYNGSTGASTFNLTVNGNVLPSGGVKFNGGAGNDTMSFAFNGSSVPPGSVSFNGSGGNNTLESAGAYTAPLANTWNLTGTNSGNINGTFTFSNVQNLVTNQSRATSGTALNQFVFYPKTAVSTGTVLTSLTGGGLGGDFLDYSHFASGVVANLTTDVVPGVTTVSKVQNVIGSTGGGDKLTGGGTGGILVSHNNGNQLTGGGGPTILIGGYGTNTLVGGSGDTILIDGKYTFDTSVVTLSKLFQEWENPLPTLQARIAQFNLQLLIGMYVTLNPYYLPNSGFHVGPVVPSKPSTLTGGSGFNWFLTTVSSVPTHLGLGSVITTH